MREKDIQEVHGRASDGMNAAIQAENAAFQQARLAGDLDSMAGSAQRIAGMRATISQLNAMAAEEINRRAAPPPGGDDLSRRDQQLATFYGLSAAEIGVAKNWTGDPNLSDEDKVRSYVENRARYQRTLASGERREDQGMQRKKFG
jgi:hypothetical protein